MENPEFQMPNFPVSKERLPKLRDKLLLRLGKTAFEMRTCNEELDIVAHSNRPKIKKSSIWKI
ncbi:hypothetical protein [Flavobacterium sp.]|uniref:hypothetical protein n=1 Tax=Flavobacterium sp. TaxID=239 RepID=UPI0037BE68C8